MDEVGGPRPGLPELRWSQISHRIHARRAGSHGLQLADEAGAWDQVVGCLLTGGVGHDSVDGTAASARWEDVATITIRVGETPWSSLFTTSS